MSQQIDAKKDVIILLLDRIRRYNPSIGSYDRSMLTENFEYSVKLTNGATYTVFPSTDSSCNIFELRFALIEKKGIKDNKDLEFILTSLLRDELIAAFNDGIIEVRYKLTDKGFFFIKNKGNNLGSLEWHEKFSTVLTNYKELLVWIISAITIVAGMVFKDYLLLILKAIQL